MSKKGVYKQPDFPELLGKTLEDATEYFFTKYENCCVIVRFNGIENHVTMTGKTASQNVFLLTPRTISYVEYNDFELKGVPVNTFAQTHFKEYPKCQLWFMNKGTDSTQSIFNGTFQFDVDENMIITTLPFRFTSQAVWDLYK